MLHWFCIGFALVVDCVGVSLVLYSFCIGLCLALYWCVGAVFGFALVLHLC